ncbi:PRTRC system protein D [Paraburkholderia dilworthii]|uniref:PRTRC system protein D n=1 Tax=Paraburkholderia dilworthii TaxID=948106 RepID=UPI000488A173|nr:PRTRC system protein D [Paraburkholderia dilworthii]
MKAPVFAVDVGFGNTKSAFRMGSDVALKMFPSLTPTSFGPKVSDSNSMAETRNVKSITVNGADFEVGPGVLIESATGEIGRTLHSEFALTDNYAALLGGSITLAGVSEVDLLMLGLPVERMAIADAVRDRYKGTFDFGHGDVKINAVKVVPQPLGSLVSFSAYGGEKGAKFDRDAIHLIVDVGYHTTDWVVAEGYVMDDRRSSGVDGGASAIYRKIANKIGETRNKYVKGVERIDKCLREKRPFSFHGSQLDLEPFLRQCDPDIKATVAKIATSVGDGEEFRSIVLTGGGASLYSNAISEQYPELPVVVLDGACYANAKGYLILGESLLARERRSASLGVAA